ncbi:MAG: hypothetical protein BWY82_02635 [Verrucomicrobia bacterium ADurb.Bin474]|nr:MAG: hypothetical protein BWY82_02635 [Verrucomicrobia bacterium ADurb.Bin474]
MLVYHVSAHLCPDNDAIVSLHQRTIESESVGVYCHRESLIPLLKESLNDPLFGQVVLSGDLNAGDPCPEFGFSSDFHRILGIETLL